MPTISITIPHNFTSIWSTAWFVYLFVFLASVPVPCYHYLICWNTPSIHCSVESRRVICFHNKACGHISNSFQYCNVDCNPSIQNMPLLCLETTTLLVVKDLKVEGYNVVFKKDNVWKQIPHRQKWKRMGKSVRDWNLLRVRTAQRMADDMTQSSDADKEERTSTEARPAEEC